MTTAVIGAGAAGCVCAYYLLKEGESVTIFDYASPLKTLLPTGGGRCNLAHAEYDFKELTKNYPRGEKFLYSVFSKFSTYDTITLFEELGVKTYVQEDGRIFPESNSSKLVAEAILSKIKNAAFIKEKVSNIISLSNGYKIKTSDAEYFFDNIIIATGGFSKTAQIKGIKNKITEIKPALVGLNSNCKGLSGIVIKDVFSKDCKITDDLLFTHFGISGPLTYKISSIKAYEDFPYTLTFDLYNKDYDLQSFLNSSPHKELKNVLSEIFPHRFAEFISGEYAAKKAHLIDSKIRDNILENIHNFKLTITKTNFGEETVTAGGYDLDEINPKTMESKLHKNLYIIGEALNIDGFCGGFNLQNAWSTAYIAAESINFKNKLSYN